MKHSKFLCMIFLWLGLVAVPVAQGAIPPSGRVEPSPLPPDAGANDLLSLDLRVYIAAKPIYCILVEKDRQRLRVLRHDGRLQVIAEYAAATGENAGPKEKEGDSKTPEGVYFITKAYLDRKVSVFGTRAFHLNYPNYFDLREGRAGYGIYIHGTNKALRLKSSNGCVTLKNSDLDRVADFLTVGTPVFIVPSLSVLTDGKGEYPNLAEHDFAGAKALLVPEATTQTDFASLYLIRINGQTVVVGEYWADQGSVQSPLKSEDGGSVQSPLKSDGGIAPPQLAVAYLQESSGNRWSVVDRGPAASGLREAEAVTIAGLPVELAGQRADRTADGGVWPTEESLPWQVSLEERYLSWCRESIQSGVLAASVLGPGAFCPAGVSAIDESAGVRDGKVYAVFFIATCISIASALLLIRRQSRRQGDESSQEAGFAEGDAGYGGRGEVQVERLRDEVEQAMSTLQTVQRRVDEEAMNVESLEALQARMKALEGTFQEKQAELDHLSAEQAAFKAQGLSEHFGQTEALGLVQRELVEVTQRLDEARQAMVLVADHEGMVHGQLAELRRWAERELEPKNGEVMQEVIAACDSLRGQVQAMAEALQSSEMSRRQELGEAGRGAAEVAEALQAYAAGMKGLRSEMAEIKGAADTGGLEAILQGLRSELREEQATKLELMGQLGRMNLLAEELAGRDQELAAVRQEGEARHTQAVAEKRDVESALEALRQELNEAEGEKSELSTRLARLDGLEAELASRDQELAAVRQEGEARHTQAVAEKRDVESMLEALRQELRAAEGEKAELSSRLARLDGVEAELAGRDQELEAARQEDETRYAQAAAEKMAVESALESLRQELNEAQATNAELTKRLVLINELEEELADRGQALERLQELSVERARETAAEKRRLDLELDSLQSELRQEQASKVELASRLRRMSELEEELASRNREVEALQDEREERQVAVALERSRLESALESLRQELQEERSLRAELTNRLGRISELEEELAIRSREVTALRQANEAATVDSMAEKSRLESNLAEIVLARQIEVTSLTSALQEAKDKALAEQESVLSLTSQVEALNESLRQVSEEQAQEQEGAMADLRQEVVTLKVMVAELEKKAAVADGVVMVKGSHYLPGDVLRQWIGKE